MTCDNYNTVCQGVLSFPICFPFPVVFSSEQTLIAYAIHLIQKCLLSTRMEIFLGPQAHHATQWAKNAHDKDRSCILLYINS